MKAKPDKPSEDTETAEIARSLEINPSLGRFAGLKRSRIPILLLLVVTVIAAAVLLW